MLLALETAFQACSVCLYDGENISLSHQIAPRQQTQLILPMIDQLLEENGLEKASLSAIAFNRGPGSFSGIRINTAVAQALAFAHDTPCVPVSSLQAQAQAVFANQGELNAVTIINDAKMSEVYLGNFVNNNGIAQIMGEEHLVPVEHDYTDLITTQFVFGDGVGLIDKQYTDAKTLVVATAPESNMLMTAEHIALLAWQDVSNNRTMPAHEAQPVYLRNNAWKTLAEQKAARKK